MPRYRVSFLRATCVSIEVEADTPAEAQEVANLEALESWTEDDPFHLEDSEEVVEIDEGRLDAERRTG